MDEDKKAEEEIEEANLKRAIAEATLDGRLHGEHRCTFCGMKHWTIKEATSCCQGLIEKKRGGRP